MNLDDKLEIGKEVSPVVPTPTLGTHAVNKGYVDGLDTSKEVKEITNTTQYTVVSEDVDKLLDFTANGGEEIDLIINTGVIPANKSIQFISSGNNTVIPVAGTGVTLAQTEGSKLKSKGKGSFVEILATNVAEIFAVTGDLEKETVSAKDIELRSPNTSSEVKFYDTETTEDLYFYLRGNAAENIFEIGSKDSSSLPEVTAMFFDRGKDFTVSKGYFRSMNPNAALIIQTLSGNTNFKNPTGNIQLSSDGDYGLKAEWLETSSSNRIVWQSKSHGTTAERPTSATHLMYEGLSYFDTDLGKPIWWDGSQWIDISGGGGSIQNITEIPNRSYNDLQDLPFTQINEITTRTEFELADKNKFNLISSDMLIPQGVFSDGDVLMGQVDLVDWQDTITVSAQNTTIESEGYFTNSTSRKIPGRGFFYLIFRDNNWYIYGDFVKKYFTLENDAGVVKKIEILGDTLTVSDL